MIVIGNEYINIGFFNFRGPYYGAYFGGNRTIYTQRATSNLVSCSEERIFWLLFDGGHFAIGSGNRLGHRIIISHHDLDPLPVRALSFSTANGVVGEFRYTFRVCKFLIPFIK